MPNLRAHTWPIIGRGSAQASVTERPVALPPVTARSVMERIERVEFLRKQIDRFLKLAEGTPDPAVSAELRKMANEYREMMDGHGSADGQAEAAPPK